VADLALPEECVLTALFRGGRLLLPKGETVLQPADEVVAIVASAQVDRLAAILSASGPQRAARAGGED
jgi:Trk K+ transport system NAD-binding subunit